MLDADAYAGILDVLRSMSLVFERSPSVAGSLGEEMLRDLFLVSLNAHYRGATAETFSRAGKTDVCIRHEGQVIFIAECKFWSGPKGIVDALDQLLGYLTWRDERAALLIFNRDRVDFPRLVSQARSAIESHSIYRGAAPSVEGADARTEFMAMLAHPRDANARLTLAVLVFDVRPPT